MIAEGICASAENINVRRIHYPLCARVYVCSNVIEKAFEHGTAEQVQKLIMEISDNDWCV